MECTVHLVGDPSIAYPARSRNMNDVIWFSSHDTHGCKQRTCRLEQESHIPQYAKPGRGITVWREFAFNFQKSLILIRIGSCRRLRTATLTVRAEMEDFDGVTGLKPLFSFGVVADIQYADKDDQGPDEEGRLQRYREATGKLEKAINAFNANKHNLQFVLTLGDIIDGNVTIEQTELDFDEVLIRLAKMCSVASRLFMLRSLNVCSSRLELKAYHLLGNHCLRLPRETLMQKLSMPALYYQEQIHPGWTLVVLDSMDLSLRWPPDTEKYKDGLKFAEEHPIVEDMSTQMASWNGGLGTEQKAWLASVLQEAERAQRRVIVAAHHPLLEGSAPFSHLMWNYDEVSSMLLASPSVVLFLCGHYHPGGCVRVGKHHFVTLQAILEAPPGTEAHAFIHVFNDHVLIEGFGFVESRILTIDTHQALT